MGEDKITRIVENVYKSTLNGVLTWSVNSSIFNSDTSHRFVAKSADGVTRFLVTINLNKDLTFNDGLLNIDNPNMIDGGIYLYPAKYKEIKNILQWLFKEKVHPVLKNINQDKVMDDILNAIDITETRDRKLDSILPTNQSTKPVEQEVKKEEKSFLQKLFGK